MAGGARLGRGQAGRGAGPGARRGRSRRGTAGEQGLAAGGGLGGVV
jgi:hypothetical protein